MIPLTLVRRLHGMHVHAAPLRLLLEALAGHAVRVLRDLVRALLAFELAGLVVQQLVEVLAEALVVLAGFLEEGDVGAVFHDDAISCHSHSPTKVKEDRSLPLVF